MNPSKDPLLTPEFIRAVPKTDLHVHLDGSLRLGTLIELARDADVELPSYEEEGLRELVFKSEYANLGEYLQGFGYTVAALQTPEALERAAYELAWDCLEEGVRYFEVRFAPQLHLGNGRSYADVVIAVNRGLENAKTEFNRTSAVRNGDDVPFEFGIIVCALRYFNAGFSPYYASLMSGHSYAPLVEVTSMASLDLARAAVALHREHGLPVVGFDLAGEEEGYPAEDHEAAFSYAHRHFLRKSVHAGEAYGPESIFQAITDLHAERIGHGTFLFDTSMIRSSSITNKAEYVEKLAQYIAAQRITIEVCLTSNMQTHPRFRSISNHPLGQMVNHRLSVTLCTDNRLVSHTTVSREIELAVEHFNLSRKEFKNLIIYGFKRSFYPGSYSQKRDYVRRAIEHYERLEAEQLAALETQSVQ